MRLPLIGGSYVARSRIANAQRCVNYFPEINREDSPVPLTYYQRPGLRQLVQDGANINPVRCIYRASNGQGFAVIGVKVYYVSSGFVLTHLGDLTVFGTGPCRMIDNGTTILLVDGSTFGYTIVLATHAFAQINDPTGSFNGANTVGFLDTFVVWNEPGTIDFGSTLSNSLTFDALYFAGKIGYPDPLQALSVNRREILLLGALKSEIWYNSGGATFPFAILPGVYIEQGCAATYSVGTIDIETIWLSRDLRGHGMIVSLKAYNLKRISNHALELAIQKMPNISDAFAYTYQIEGHSFYVITFPSGNQTWACDMSLVEKPELAWHQRCWTDANGGLNRERLMSHAFLYGKNVGGDWQNGKIYELDQDYYFDDASGVGLDPITCIKGFPHNFQGIDPLVGGMAPSDNRRMIYRNFQADIEVGDIPLNSDGSTPQVTLRVSRDRGKTFDTVGLQSMGNPGQYETAPQWLNLGLARDMVFELSHSLPGPAALNGAWVQCEVNAS